MESAPEKMIDGHNTPGVVRRMSVNDLDRIMEIEQKSFIAPWSKGMFEETIFSPLSRGFVIEKNNVIVGYIIFYSVDVEGHIMNLAVAPSERRRGYGRQLLTHALAFFKEQGATECYLEVREHNENAQRLYSLFGFEVIGRRKKYYPETGEDALVMQLLL